MPRPETRALVLTCLPGSAALDESALAAARQHLHGRAIQSERWLKRGEAGEILFIAEPEDALLLGKRIVEALSPRPLDANIVVADARRRKRLLVADMDSTIIEQECIDELADMLRIKPQVAAITERAMRGEIAFEPALRERVALLAGLDLETIEQVVAKRITPMPGAARLVKTMTAHGAHTALVSGGFSLFTSRVANWLGFHSHHSNTLLLDGGRLTGLVAEPVLGRDAKRATLVDLAHRLGLTPEETLAVGDGANDLAMIEAAGLGVAFRAKPAVAAMADARITHGDLTALLYLQGYAEAEIID